MVLGIYPQEKKCFGMVPENRCDEMNFFEMDREICHEEVNLVNSQKESNLAELKTETFNVEMECTTFHKEMNLGGTMGQGENFYTEMDRENHK